MDTQTRKILEEISKKIRVPVTDLEQRIAEGCSLEDLIKPKSNKKLKLYGGYTAYKISQITGLNIRSSRIRARTLQKMYGYIPTDLLLRPKGSNAETYSGTKDARLTHAISETSKLNRRVKRQEDSFADLVEEFKKMRKEVTSLKKDVQFIQSELF